MNLLLDTHVYLWVRSDSARLPESFKSVIQDGKNLKFVSSISLAEIAVKKYIGKLAFDVPLLDNLNAVGFQELSFTPEHARELELLPLLHRDPFDRMLIAQARVEEMIFLSVDSQIRQYEVSQLDL